MRFLRLSLRPCFLAYIPFQYVKGRCGVAALETNQFRAVKIRIIFFCEIKKREKNTKIELFLQINTPYIIIYKKWSRLCCSIFFVSGFVSDSDTVLLLLFTFLLFFGYNHNEYFSRNSNNSFPHSV